MTDKADVAIAIPKEVEELLGTFRAAGHEAYIVGGCVRDALLGLAPKDWDIATNAKPEQIQELFSDSVYENQFGTVGIKTRSEDTTLAVVEATTFRKEEGYNDGRHPDRVSFAASIQEDLARRDFTVNALAYDGKSLLDPYGGAQDLKEKLIRAVGDPKERFTEDALRLMRAPRFAAQLGFHIEEQTQGAIRENSPALARIAAERIGDEFRKLLEAPNAADGIELLRELKLLPHVLPELEEGWGITQNKHHIYTVWEHNLRALRYASEQEYNPHVRLAALLHDVGKPRSKRGEGPDSTFYGHQVIGARMTEKALERLKFPKKDIEKVSLLVHAHMFNYDPEVATDASVRRLVAKVGPENMMELVQLREADRIGSGVPKAVPYKLRHFMFRIEKVLTEPVSRKQMAVNGDVLIEKDGFKPGQRLGAVLDTLFDEVLDDPSRNTEEALRLRARELHALSDKELDALRKQSKEKYEALLQEEEETIKRKYAVQ